MRYIIFVVVCFVSSVGANAPADFLSECEPNQYELYANEILQIGLDKPRFRRSTRFLALLSLSIPHDNLQIKAVTLAQAGLETGYGKSKLSKSRNYFGINYISKSKFIKDVARLITGKVWSKGDNCYKSVFKSDNACFEYHRALLKGRYYQDGMSTGQLTKSLQRNGYAADKKYANKLNYIIKKFNL
jgi:flagellum-specific peptidoglycan hydrolase FlgJ